MWQLIERTGDPRDTRAVRLALTDRGRTAIRLAIATVEGLLDEFLAPRSRPRAHLSVRPRADRSI